MLRAQDRPIQNELSCPAKAGHPVMMAWRLLDRPPSRAMTAETKNQFWPAAASLEIALELGGGLFGAALDVERRDEPAVLAHQIDDRGVVHGVAAAVGRHLLGIDPVGLFRRGDGGSVA